MTTYQDQPLSRRAIREREAAERAAAEAAASGTAVPETYIPQPGGAASQVTSPVQHQPGADAYRTAPVGAVSYSTAPHQSGAIPQGTPDAAAASTGVVPEQTMTRRQLRALREAEEQAAQHAAASHVATPVSAAPVLAAPHAAQPFPQQPAPQQSVVSSPQVAPLAAAQPVAPPPLVEPVAPQPSTIEEFEELLRATGAVPAVPGGYAPSGVQPAPVQPMPQPHVQAQPVQLPPVAGAPAPVDAAPLASPPEAQASPVAERPRNHWSRQAELDDEAQPRTGSLAREVGLGSVTANALVLPAVPNPDIIVSSVTSTGDVLMTGSISLPSSLSSTGALPTQLDESDLDNLLDMGDQQVTSTDSQPVRAIRAVSTHTSSREIIGASKPRRGNRVLTALIITAGSMAVVVVALLAVVLVSGVLD